MGADYSFYVKSIVTYDPTFLGYNNSVSAIVCKASVFHKWLYDEIKTYVRLFSMYIVHTYLVVDSTKGNKLLCILLNMIS
jgi:hypothetical protein